MKNTLMALIAGAMLVLATGASGAALPSGDWTGFGRTTDNMRHSPLTEITPSNVSDLGRAYTIDFHAVDPDVRRGEQSYPLAVGGTLYVTTNDANVFAIDGARARSCGITSRRTAASSRTSGSSPTAASPTAMARSSF